MTDEGIFRRRNLPPIDVVGKPSFITACLEGSISTRGLKQIRKYRDELESRKKPQQVTQHDWNLRIHKLVFKFVDSLIDGDPV